MEPFEMNLASLHIRRKACSPLRIRGTDNKGSSSIYLLDIRTTIPVQLLSQVTVMCSLDLRGLPLNILSE